MLGAFLGFWAVLPRLEAGVLTVVLAPVGLLFTVAVLAAALLPRARRAALGMALGLLIGTGFALVIGVGLVAASAGS